MKKVIAIITTFILSVSVIMAQSTPDGINYQAVARNLKGEILAKQPVSLKVSLFKVNNNQRVEYYREIQQVTTSTVGVFSVALGKGQAEFGQFVDVPWSTENIWMEISIKSKGDADFTSISSNKLLAVPYAFHSITAERLANGSGNVSNATSTTTTTNGTPSNSWLVFSNRSSNPLTDRLGTGDYTDLNIATNYEPRIIVKADGRTQFVKSATFQDTVYAEKSVRLNTVSGNTINYGNFTVDRKSSTALTGTLKVDSSTQLQQTLRVGGVTDLMSNLNVNNLSPTFLSGTLKVDGITDLNNNLNVNNKKSTLLTGTLTVDSPSIFKSYVKLTNSALDQDTAGGGSGAIPTGALQVMGGGYFGGNVVIKKNLKVGGELASGVLIATSDSESVSTTTGALRVKGGAGITRNVNIGGAVKIDSTLTVQKDVVFNSTTQSSDSTNGSLAVKGGVGIIKNLNVGGALTTKGVATINNTLNVNSTDSYAANFKTSGDNGINIQIGAAPVHYNNQFITFRDKNGVVKGAVRGETDQDDLSRNTAFNDEETYLGLELGFQVAEAVIKAAEVVFGGVKVVCRATATTICAGFGACFTAPIPSLIIESGAELVLNIANAFKIGLGITTASVQFAYHRSHHEDEFGVTYASGAADYAEWLPKKNVNEKFSAGDVVCMKNGFISKTYEVGGKMMVISTNPIVLGNENKAIENKTYEKVAFMGQVPVKVIGSVEAGDYIVSADYLEGFGKAVHPDNMKLSDYKKVIGVSWEGSKNGGLVNTAVGLNNNEYTSLITQQDEKIKKQEQEITELKNSISNTNAILTKLLPGFSSAIGSGMTNAVIPTVKNQETNAVTTNNANVSIQPEMITPDESMIHYTKVDNSMIEEFIATARKVAIKSGVDFSKDPFWSKIDADPNFKASVIADINQKIEEGQKEMTELNKKQHHFVELPKDGAIKK